MELLQQARAEIDAIDAQMAALFEQRMQAVARVAQARRKAARPSLTRSGSEIGRASCRERV